MRSHGFLKLESHLHASLGLRMQDAPLMSFVRDGHEQKLLQWKNEREQLERWQVLEQLRQSFNSEMAAAEVAAEASNESEKTEVDVQHQVNCDCHITLEMPYHF